MHTHIIVCTYETYTWWPCITRSALYPHTCVPQIHTNMFTRIHYTRIQLCARCRNRYSQVAILSKTSNNDQVVTYLQLFLNRNVKYYRNHKDSVAFPAQATAAYSQKYPALFILSWICIQSTRTRDIWFSLVNISLLPDIVCAETSVDFYAEPIVL